MSKPQIILAAALVALGCSVWFALSAGSPAPKPDIQLLAVDDLRDLADGKDGMFRLMRHFASLRCGPAGLGSLADLDGPARLVAATIVYDEMAAHGFRPFPGRIPENLSWQTAATAYERMQCRPMADLIRAIAARGADAAALAEAGRILPLAHAARLRFIHEHAEELAR